MAEENYRDILFGFPRRTRRAFVGSLIAVLAVSIVVVAPQPASSAGRLSATTVSPDTAYWTQVSTANASSIRADGVDVASDGTVITTGSFSGQAVFPTGANADDSIVLTRADSSMRQHFPPVLALVNRSVSWEKISISSSRH